jgi:hypothetical protein
LDAGHRHHHETNLLLPVSLHIRAFHNLFWGGGCGEVVERNSTDTSMLLSVPLEINNNNNNNNNSPMILFDEELPAMFSSLVGPPVMLQHPESDYHH